MTKLAAREEVRALLAERGYREFPVSDLDRHDANWQKRSDVYREDDGETQRGYIDIREWQFDPRKYRLCPPHPRFPDSYEVGARFETPYGWLDFKFYGLNPDELMARLPALEDEIRALQERLLGTESEIPTP